MVCPDLRLSRKWHKNDHNKNRSGSFLSGFVSGQVGQESNLQPAVLEFTCLPITLDNGLQPVIPFSPPHQARCLRTTITSPFPIFAQLSADCRRALPSCQPGASRLACSWTLGAAARVAAASLARLTAP